MNVYDQLSPFCSEPESNLAGPLVVVTVCGAVSSLTHFTVWPTFTVSFGWANL